MWWTNFSRVLPASHVGNYAGKPIKREVYCIYKMCWKQNTVSRSRRNFGERVLRIFFVKIMVAIFYFKTAEGWGEKEICTKRGGGGRGGPTVKNKAGWINDLRTRSFKTPMVLQVQREIGFLPIRAVVVSHLFCTDRYISTVYRESVLLGWTGGNFTVAQYVKAPINVRYFSIKKKFWRWKMTLSLPGAFFFKT